MTEVYLSGGLLIAIQAASLFSVILFILIEGWESRSKHYWGGTLLTALLVLLIGLRPISGLYIDMTTYALAFERSKWGLAEASFSDPLFNLFTNISAAIMPVEAYFFLCAALYVVPKTIAAREIFGPRATIALAAMASSFSFYSFATNGIRNGIAVSLALLAMAWPRVSGKVVLGAIAILTHISLVLSMAAYVIAGKVRSIGVWLAFWLAAIPLSFLLPGKLFSQIALLQIDRRTNYFEGRGEAIAEFRPDFILYSGLGVAAIVYWKSVRKLNDPEFERLACTYLIANGVWIMINQVAFSNRFAYLSWFLLEIIILFPMLRSKTGAIGLPAVGLVVFNTALTLVIM